jgi:hypothetical protein
MRYQDTAVQIYEIPASSDPDTPASVLHPRPRQSPPWLMLVAWGLALLVFASSIVYVGFGIFSQLPAFSPPGTEP